MITEKLRSEIETKLHDPVFIAACQQLAAEHWDRWQMTDTEDVEVREELYHRQRLLVDVLQALQDLATPPPVDD